VVEPDPFGPRVDPLGEVLISELPEGFDGIPGPPVTGLDWPVVAPGGLPVGAVLVEPPGVDPLIPEEPLIPPLEDAPAAPPPAPPACASAIELESANAPANAIVASLIVVSLVVE
jgi:hypothetical protein